MHGNLAGQGFGLKLSPRPRTRTLQDPNQAILSHFLGRVWVNRVMLLGLGSDHQEGALKKRLRKGSTMSYHWQPLKFAKLNLLVLEGESGQDPYHNPCSV